ncbi:hypothetical protein OHB41_34130 [Streptomyces sp. NBC_01571]|uniref:hypothetical protein n=1 Tax=Streptomyces sp. NBC_01571 TaxID=2975883 RepID=UPI00224D5A7D|nr:hypothetical protein [Streptomyces sp. NBC_01571]MCX4578142.1 hypothetical protein [Streptomyces sp. NBC_01571]
MPHQPGTCFCGDCMTCARLNAPTLYGFLGKRPGEPAAFAQVFAWCPWCAGWHRHGDATNKPGDVLHRYPHCICRGPWEATGYLIAVTNLPLAKVWGRMRRASDAQRQAIGDGRVTSAIERLRRQPLPMLLPEHHGGRTI